MGLVIRIVMIIGISIGYIYNTVRGIMLISKSLVLSPMQKLINSILTVIFPFFWFYIMKGFLTFDTQVVTKEVRDERRKKNKGPVGEVGGLYG